MTGVERDAAASHGGASGLPARREWGLRAWVRAVLEIRSVTPAGRETVLREIGEGSQPTVVYYVLLGISEVLAGFALIVDSDALLIGANVVAPLMTPIFGISLGLMRGDLTLLRRALLAEFGGAVLGVALCYLLGLMPLMGDPTAALLSQTRPTLIDLIVAALAGFAGLLALIDQRISPALPGVAIATALNPPIAAIGLCLALGAFDGAWGAFLLFFANVLAILAVAALLFLVSGFVTASEIGSVRGLVRRFAAAAVGLVFVTVLLTDHLLSLVATVRTRSTIEAVLDEALSHQPNTALVSVDFSRPNGSVDVLSTISTPRVIAPDTVKRVQDDLSQRLGEPVRLFIRSAVTADVSATGSANIRPYFSLNGRVTEARLSPAMRILQQAEQVAREVAATRPDLVLKDIELVQLRSGPVIVIAIEGPHPPTSDEVARFEAPMRERLGEPALRVVMRQALSKDVTSKGRILFGDAHFGTATTEEGEQRAAVERTVRAAVEELPNMFAPAVDAVRKGEGWLVRAEIVGPRVPTPAEVRVIERGTAKSLGESVTLSVWARTELKVTGEGYTPIGE